MDNYLTVSLIDFLYQILCVFGPCMIYQSIVVKTHSDIQRKILIKHFIWVYIFLIYLYLALNKAGIGSIWDIGKYGTIIRLEEINLIPFQAGGFMTHILNIIMFMPLGFLLPLIWKSFRNGVGVLVTGLGFSLAIEIAQLFNRRLTDVDDLIMNTIGTLIGFIIWKVFTKIFKRKEATHFSLQVNEAAVYITLSVLGTFCLYNWRFLYTSLYS